MPGIANHKDGKNFGSQAGASMGDGRSEEGRKVVEEEIAVSPPPPPPSRSALVHNELSLLWLFCS